MTSASHVGPLASSCPETGKLKLPAVKGQGCGPRWSVLGTEVVRVHSFASLDLTRCNPGGLPGRGGVAPSCVLRAQVPSVPASLPSAHRD